MTQWKDTKEKQDSKLKTWVPAILFALGVLLLTLGMLFFKEQHGATMQIGWLIPGLILEQFFSHMIMVVVAIMVIYLMYRSTGRRYIWIVVTILALYLAVVDTDSLRTYEINDKHPIFAEIMFNVVRDTWGNEYDTLSCEKCDITEYTITRSSRHGSSDNTYYFLDVNSGEYVLPIPYGNRYNISQFLKSQNGIYEIEVYVNTKFIVGVNGIRLNEITADTMKRYQLEQTATQCTLTFNEEQRFVVKENIEVSEHDYRCISYFNPDKLMRASLGISDGDEDMAYRDEDGTWCVFVTNRFFECVSNIILYDVKDGEINNVRSGDISILDDYLPPEMYYAY